MRHRNRNTVFPHLTYELALSHLHALQECVETYRLPPVLKRQFPVAVCTIIEQFCRTKKKFLYEAGESVPQKLTLNMPLVMDMLDWSDSWCIDNTSRHEEALRKRVPNATGDDHFTISIKDLDALIDDACDIRQPLLIESLAASTLNFQSVKAVNSLDVANRVFDNGAIGVDGYIDLFERRHTHTHTLEDTKISPKTCIALALGLFEAVLGRDDFAFYSGLALSETNRHEKAVRSLESARSRPDWRYLGCYGRSLAHVSDSRAEGVLHGAMRSLLEHVGMIPEHKTEAAWLRMEAARAMCGLADGFRAAKAGDYEACVDSALVICEGSADACWLASGRLAQLGFPHHLTIKFAEKAYELAGNVDTAYEVGMACFKLERYENAVEWLNKAEKHDPHDMDVKLALEQAKSRLP